MALHATAAASLATWAAQHAGLYDPAMLMAVAASAALGVGLLTSRWLASKEARLRWDGQQWTVDTVPVRLAVMLDISGWLLLKAKPLHGHPRWLAASQAEAGAAWHALRVAAYARPRPEVAT